MAESLLSETNISADPFEQFNIWFMEKMHSGDAIPDAVNLGTASSSGRVSVRTVLLKGFDSNGFVFYTNYDSKKGLQLLENPFAALHFHWAESGRQIRIEGKTEKLSDSQSAEYFQTRPRESQIGSWASQQSSIIPDRLYLEKRFKEFQSYFHTKKVEKPPYWGGFRLIPDFFEFWSNGKFRLHDRIIYRNIKGQWEISRLAP